MKKIIYLGLLSFSMGLLISQESDQDGIAGNIADRDNLDYILDVDSLFSSLEEGAEAAEEAEQTEEPQEDAQEDTEDDNADKGSTTLTTSDGKTIIIENFYYNNSPNNASSNEKVVPGEQSEETSVKGNSTHIQEITSQTNIQQEDNQNSKNRTIRNEINISLDNTQKQKKKENLTNSSQIDNNTQIDNSERRSTTDLAIEYLRITKYIKSKNYELALKRIAKVKDLYPDLTRLYNMEGSIYYKLKFYELAVKSWKKSLEINPEQPLVESFVERLE